MRMALACALLVAACSKSEPETPSQPAKPAKPAGSATPAAPTQPPKKPAPLAVEVAIPLPPVPSGHVLIGGPGFDSRGAPNAVVDPIPLLQLLREKRFAELERELTWLDGEFRRDVRNEDWIVDALLAFDVDDPRLSPPLTEWVAASPKSWLAHAARGSYLTGRAAGTRGSQTADKTEPAKLSGYEDLLAAARTELRSALALDPKAIAIYALLLHAREPDDKGAFADGHKACPQCVRIYLNFISVHKPKWGGSYAEMEATIAEAQKYADKNPRLEMLRGAADAERCLEQAWAQRFDEALKLCDRALAVSEVAGTLVDKAKILISQKRVADALPLLDRALVLRPRSIDGLVTRAGVLAKLGRLEDAAKDVELWWLVKSGSPATLGTMREMSHKLAMEADVRLRAGKLDEARTHAELALRSDANNLDAHYFRAAIHERSAEPAKAKAEIDEMLRRDPDSIPRIGAILRTEKRDQDAIELWTMALRSRPDWDLAYARRAVALHDLGKTAEAKADLEKACAIAPTGGPCREARSDVK